MRRQPLYTNLYAFLPLAMFVIIIPQKIQQCTVFVQYLYERGHGLGSELGALYLLPISLMSQNWTLTDSWRWINSPDSLMMVMRNRLNFTQILYTLTDKYFNMLKKYY